MRNILSRGLPFALIASSLLFISCNEDDKPKTLPVVTTSPVTEVTITTAKGGGVITDRGNDDISASGLVYSNTSTTPTVDNGSKIEGTLTDEAFSSDITGLTSGTTYYTRAYATNSLGTSYGDLITFTTGNAAPAATNVTIGGKPIVLKKLTATYTYSDAENDTESGTTVQWYIANDAGGSGETPIAGATSLTYMLLAANEFKFLRIGIITKAATGSTLGAEVKSGWIGPIAAEPTTITFTYNGNSVSYGIIISPTTGRRWMDRNLGAPNTPSSFDDFANFGDLFQWGRSADGHQLINRANTSGGTTGVNSTTSELSSSDSPSNLNFIVPSSVPYDWRNPKNDNLWQSPNQVNSPCPIGWRIPSKTEWESENLSNMVSETFKQLKITSGGRRSGVSGSFSSVMITGYYWSSTIFPAPSGSSPSAYGFQFSTTGAESIYTDVRSAGFLCRCIKD